MAITVATLQTQITADVRQNGAHIRTLMSAAAAAGARLVHLPEAALSGYVMTQIGGWAGVDWNALQEELEATATLARQLGLWAVIGSNHHLPPHPAAPGPAPWPQNSLHVISDQGAVIARYSKRKLSNAELTWWYTPGADPLAFTVDGVRFGCALCVEVVFPTLFADYERMGTDCILLSLYSADPRYGLMARAHAATNCFWLSLSGPAATSDGNPSCLFGPDGTVLAACPQGRPGMVVQTIDPADPRFALPLNYVRPWRAHVTAEATPG